MAAPIVSKKLLTKDTEIAYGTLIAGAITNGDYTVELGPGFWSVQLFVNANTVSAGTIACYPLDAADGALSEEPFCMAAQGISQGATLSLIDLVGPAYVLPVWNDTKVSPAYAPIGVYNKIQFTIASIAGAGATNRIDYVAQRIS